MAACTTPAARLSLKHSIQCFRCLTPVTRSGKHHVLVPAATTCSKAVAVRQDLVRMTTRYADSALRGTADLALGLQSQQCKQKTVSVVAMHYDCSKCLRKCRASIKYADSVSQLQAEHQAMLSKHERKALHTEVPHCESNFSLPPSDLRQYMGTVTAVL